VERIVVAAKAGSEQPWLADAAAELAGQSGAAVDVVSADGIDVEASSTLPRAEAAEPAERAATTMAERIRAAGVDATPHTLSGPVVRAVLVFAEHRDADLIVCGGSTRGALARRLLGDNSMQLIRRARRPVLVISPPGKEDA
jgi:nucleotide-binding universal stress UspA family protein